ncbi:hypothetical protein [Paludisphaera soli]|nr:hypothetical protein [Paludisphaera soli]
MGKKPEPQYDLFGEPVEPRAARPKPGVVSLDFEGKSVRVVERDGVTW